MLHIDLSTLVGYKLFIFFSWKVVTAAQILNCLLDSIRPAQIESTLTFLEIGLVAKLSLTFLAAMDSVYPATVLLNASSNIISIMRDEVFSEWSKPDNLATVYRAISSFEGFLMTVKSGTTCGPLKPSSGLLCCNNLLNSYKLIYLFNYN